MNVKSVTNTGWKIIDDSNSRFGSAKGHWLKRTEIEWPEQCSYSGCSNTPTIGAIVINADVTDEKIIPMCECHAKGVLFDVCEQVMFVGIPKIEVKLHE